MAGKEWFLLLIVAFLLTPGLALGAEPTPATTPVGDRCLRSGDLCLPETNFSITSILDTASVAASDWENVAGKATPDWWEGASYKILDDYGITREQFDAANASKSIKPQSLLLVVMPFVLLFFLLFCILDVKNPISIFREGSAEWGFLETVKEKLAPGWPLTELLETEYKKGFHKRIIAGLDTPMFGRILGELGKKSVAGMNPDEASGAMKSLGEINGKLKEQAKNVIRGILMDVATMLTAAEYAVPMMVVFVLAYFTITGVLPVFEASKDWVPLLLIIYEMLAITFWAFWLWEIISFMLVRSGFLLAMVFPIAILKFLYIPFTGGGIRIVARIFQVMGMMWMIAALKPAAKADPLGLALGMTASMTLYVLLVLIVLAGGVLFNLAAESVATPFVALLGLVRKLSAAAASVRPSSNLPMVVPQPGGQLPGGGFGSLVTKDMYGREVKVTKRQDGMFQAFDKNGAEIGPLRSAQDLASWAENAGVNLGSFLGARKGGGRR